MGWGGVGQAVDHMRSTLSTGSFLSICNIPDGEARPDVCTVDDVLCERTPAQAPALPSGLVLEADNRDGDMAPSAPLGNPNVMFFRIVHTKPRSMKNVRWPVAVSGRLRQSDIAVAVHQAYNSEATSALVSADAVSESMIFFSKYRAMFFVVAAGTCACVEAGAPSAMRT